MRDRQSKQNPVRLSKTLQQELSDALHSKENTVPSQGYKRRLEAEEFDLHPSPSKRARLETLDGEDDQTALQHPQPTHPYALFLQDLVDPFYLDSAVPEYPPDSLQSFVSQWLESIDPLSATSERERCRSDSCLCSPPGVSVPVPPASLPDMNHFRGNTPDSTPSRGSPLNPEYQRVPRTGSNGSPEVTPSFQSSGKSPGGKSLVEQATYRSENLEDNNILLQQDEAFPDHVVELIERIKQGRGSPGPSRDKIKNPHTTALGWGANESNVETHFSSTLFPNPGLAHPLQLSSRLPMSRHWVPDSKSLLKVSNPVPDLLYGYNKVAFNNAQRLLMRGMARTPQANSDGLLYPFLTVEFKGDGPNSSGNRLWVATNQCLGASSTSVNIAERLHVQVSECEKTRPPVETTTFSIAMNNYYAALYVTWKQDEFYYMGVVDEFCTRQADAYLRLRRYILNILDWGRGTRLDEIRAGLDALLESQNKASRDAKTRPAPARDATPDSTSKRYKPSLGPSS